MSAAGPLPLPPHPDEDSVGFWAGVRSGELRLQRCLDCGLVRFPPAPLCPRCLSVDSHWQRMKGDATVFSWVVVHRHPHPGFGGDLPYNVALVQLDEGPRLTTRIVGCDLREIHIGMPVEVVFEPVGEGVVLPCFRPRGGRLRVVPGG